jgi:D-galacturonate reductase
MQPLNIVVIGTGMFATGRGTQGFGTVLPAISEWKRSGNNIGKVIFVGTNGAHSSDTMGKFEGLAQQTGVLLDVDVLPKGKTQDPQAYLEAIKQIPRPACAVIVVPDHLHYEVARSCLLADLPVLVVKPLAPTVNEGLRLVNLSIDRNLYAAVEFHKRWDKANLMVRDAILGGRIGEPLYCWVEYSQRKSIPTEIFKAWSFRTSILQYLGIHYIDIVRFCTDAIPLRVMATGQKTWLKERGIDTWDSIQCVIEWQMPSGALFVQTVLTNWIDPETTSSMSDQKIKFVGTKGRIESDQKERGLRFNIDDQCLEQPNPDFCMVYGANDGSKQWRGYGIDSVFTFFSDVVDIYTGKNDINTLNKLRPTFAEALISTAIVEAAHKSLAAENTWQSVRLEECE